MFKTTKQCAARCTIMLARSSSAGLRQKTHSFARSAVLT